MPSCFCRICGRYLRDPLSVRLGIGPVCHRAINGQPALSFIPAPVLPAADRRQGKYIFIPPAATDTAAEQLGLDFGTTDAAQIYGR